MRINVSVIVIHGKKVLLMQRSLKDDYFPGAWGIPGGYMEPEELQIEETAVREVFEEMGIKVRPLTLLFNNRNNETDTLYLVMSAELNDEADANRIKLSEEANDFKWASKEDIDKLEYTPYTKNRIDKALKLL